ncbi:MAG: bifunctional folylpolyglutamate synthase/dihydrofolate synthase, partial [Bacteroidota bacterium]|nr:bifunctional folylpolyglutamate synthase/dihydrofolate synthase [Bacteroidota bacterium]
CKDIFIEKANNLNSKIIFANEIFSIPYSMQNTEGLQVFNVESKFDNNYKNLAIDLLGQYQKKNVITCLAAIKILIEKGFRITKAHIYEALKQASKITGLSGRWQIIGHNPLIVADAGHNEEGIKQVMEQIKTTAYKNLHIIIGMVNDKNIDKILSLMPKNASYYFTKANIPRALSEKELKEQAKKYALSGSCFSTVEKALNHAKSLALPEDFIFVGGSTFVAAEAI